MQLLHIKLEACRKCGRPVLNDRDRVKCPHCGHTHGGIQGIGFDSQLMSETRYARRFWRVPYREVTNVGPTPPTPAEG